MPASAFDGSIKYLGAQVESDPEMRPLTPIVSVGYAFRAGTADGGWVDDGTVVRLETTTDSVGIGTTGPECRLEVKSSGYADGIKITSSDGDQLFRVRENGDGSCAIYVSNNLGDTRVKISGGGTSYFNRDNVGVGTTSPNSRLHVNGSAALAYRAVTPGETLTDSDCIVMVFSVELSPIVYLPSATNITGRVYTIKSKSFYPLRVQPLYSQTIDGASGVLLMHYDWLTVVSDGSGWLIIGRSR